ncbi:hypothetical protein GWI76_10450 [Proteus sp. G2659]|uniref:hypothetical protein n=1 Tax=Proteus sp. G2659 TaxID=2698872 RepID=UPI0013766D53|nr:hypothetical protein [Proteus sp. G2659]NBM79674.1 hypothetical protein [Proteus sp. G2659]
MGMYYFIDSSSAWTVEIQKKEAILQKKAPTDILIHDVKVYVNKVYGDNGDAYLIIKNSVLSFIF